MCSRWFAAKESDCALRQASAQKFDCPFEIVLIRGKGDDAALWKMQVVNGSHTGHLPCTKVEQFKALPATRRSTLTPEIHEEILTLRRCRATPRIIANKLSDDGVWIGVQDVKNIIRKYKHEL